MYRLLFSLLTLGCLAATPQLAAAQDGGFPIKTTPTTQFLFQDGMVVRRDGNVITNLTQNVKLSSGVKINYKNGIVEMPADEVHLGGKKFTMHEGDYVRADGGIVFATPASAAAASGDNTKDANAKYEKYVQKGGLTTVDPARHIELLNKKIELLNRKVSLLSAGQAATTTAEVDRQLKEVDEQIRSGK